MQKEYEHLIFDADHTLLDYISDELAAFRALYTELGLPLSSELLSESRLQSETVWTQAGLYDVHTERIQREYHALYRSHVTGIFENVFRKYPCAADPVKAGARFLELLREGGRLFPEAEGVLRALSRKTGGKYAISIATNGLSCIQNGRLSALSGYVDGIFVSEALGSIKPLPDFFEKILRRLAVPAAKCLMIGDSLSSDIAGAKGAGIDSCWYNPRGAANPTEYEPDYEIGSLSELLHIL